MLFGHRDPSLDQGVASSVNSLLGYIDLQLFIPSYLCHSLTTDCYFLWINVW